MKEIRVDKSIDADKFAATFRRTVPRGTNELDTGCVYGFITQNIFCLYRKSNWVGMGASVFWDGMGVYLSGEVREGHIFYTYRRTALHVLVTGVVPLLALLISLFPLIVFRMPHFLPLSAVSLILFPFWFYKPKGKMANLCDCMMRLIEESQSRQ